jgi:hypothetical protein
MRGRGPFRRKADTPPRRIRVRVHFALQALDSGACAATGECALIMMLVAAAHPMLHDLP